MNIHHLHIENVFDMRSIISKIRSIKGVIRTEAYQPIRIKWHKEWLKKEDNGQDSFGLRLIYYSSDFFLSIFVKL